jgi:hypothetical protein
MSWDPANWIDVAATTRDGKALHVQVMSPESAAAMAEQDDSSLYLGLRVDMSNYVPNGGDE